MFNIKHSYHHTLSSSKTNIPTSNEKIPVGIVLTNNWSDVKITPIRNITTPKTNAK